MISVNWLLNDKPLSVKESLILELADDLLVGNSAATLRKALTDSGLGESVIGGGLSSELLQNTYSIGLKVRIYFFTNVLCCALACALACLIWFRLLCLEWRECVFYATLLDKHVLLSTMVLLSQTPYSSPTAFT